jgi:superfamily II DNA/RNA helicase
MLKDKPTVLVGGPARILELIHLKKFKTNGIAMVILDETDRMLAPELRDILRDLLAVLPASAQYVACSATLSTYHASLLEKMIPARENPPTTAPEAEAQGADETFRTVSGSAQPSAATARKTNSKYRIRMVNLPPEDVLKRNITHWAFYCEGRDKIDNLRKFILAEKPAKALVFTAIAGQVENIVAQLNFRKIPCSGLYAKLDKMGRKKAMDDFRSGRSTVLVTSDLAARGLDIPGVTHIIQLDVNENEDFFIHRAGRTARAGKSGINAIFGDERELRSLSRIEKKLGIVIYPKLLYGGAVRTPEQVEDEEDGSKTESGI